MDLPAHPERSRGASELPVHPERSRGASELPVHPERSRGALSVTEITDPASFMALEHDWDALVDSIGAPPFLRHAFIRIWKDNFAPTSSLRVLTARDDDGRLVGVLPLMRERARVVGMPVTELASTANPHSCRFDLLALDGEQVAPLFLDRLLQEGVHWDLLRVIDIPEGGSGMALLDAAQKRGLPTGTWKSLASPYFFLPPTFAELQDRLQSKFRANMRRRRKKLEQRGHVTVELVTGGPKLDAALEEGFSLEQSGWKGRRGTAMAQDAKTRGFYTELARHLSQQGELALYFLRLDGRAVGFHYGVIRGGTYYLLKPGYDESLKECSPGQLLMEDVLKDLIHKGLGEFDFLGPDMTWKRDWTDLVRVHTWLFIFRDTTFGRALCRAKFDWAPKAKEAIARWRR